MRPQGVGDVDVPLDELEEVIGERMDGWNLILPCADVLFAQILFLPLNVILNLFDEISTMIICLLSKSLVLGLLTPLSWTIAAYCSC